MAQIFPVYDGMPSGKWGDVAWSDCVRAFELDEMCRTEERPTFQSVWDVGGSLPNQVRTFPSQVVIWLDEPEASWHGTAPGYFVSPLDGIGAKIKLAELIDAPR